MEFSHGLLSTVFVDDELNWNRLQVHSIYCICVSRNPFKYAEEFFSAHVSTKNLLDCVRKCASHFWKKMHTFE